MTVGVTLARIEQWLTAHAPGTLATLNPPATLDALDQAESVIGTRLLPDLKRVYLWHNGAGCLTRPFWLIPDYSLMELARVTAQWQLWQEITADDPDQPYRRWVPIATAFTGDFIAIDHGRDAAGTACPVYKDDGPNRDRSWPSIAAVLDELLHALEAGQPARGWRARVNVDGMLEWEASQQPAGGN